MCCLILSQCKDLRAGLIREDFGALTTARAKEFWMCWRRFSIGCSKVSCSELQMEVAMVLAVLRSRYGQMQRSWRMCE